MSNYPHAIQRPGPAGKTWSTLGDRNAIGGVVLHSMQGSYEGALTVLDDESVTEQNAYRAASWHFSITKDGTVYQHYPVESAPFHAGSRYWNDRLIGIEHEGGAPGNLAEPLTEAQYAASIALVRWIARIGGWPVEGGRLYAHNQVTATSCPSGRIDWSRYMPENDPNREDNFDTGLARLRYEAMLRVIVQGHKEAEGDPQVLHDIIDGRR